jgi:hypothetical protein
MPGFGFMARPIVVQLTDPAGTTAGGIDLTPTPGRTGRCLDHTSTPIRTPFSTPAVLCRISGDIERSDDWPIAAGPAMSLGAHEMGTSLSTEFPLSVSVASRFLSLTPHMFRHDGLAFSPLPCSVCVSAAISSVTGERNGDTLKVSRRFLGTGNRRSVEIIQLQFGFCRDFMISHRDTSSRFLKPKQTTFSQPFQRIHAVGEIEAFLIETMTSR